METSTGHSILLLEEFPKNKPIQELLGKSPQIKTIMLLKNRSLPPSLDKNGSFGARSEKGFSFSPSADKKLPAFDKSSLGLDKNFSLDKSHCTPRSEKGPSFSPSADKRVILYKTELCRSLTDDGFCKYGNRCQFAHSAEELRPVPRHPRYKTELCLSYLEGGERSGVGCAYGKRCCFIHTAEEVQRLPEDARAKISEEDLRKLTEINAKEKPRYHFIEEQEMCSLLPTDILRLIDDLACS